MKTNREKGNQLEALVVNYLKPIEPKARQTKGSGNSTELEDVLSSLLMVQCKVDNTHKNIIIKIDDWRQLNNKIPIGSKRIPIFVNQQQDEIKTVTMNINDFFGLLYKSEGLDVDR